MASYKTSKIIKELDESAQAIKQSLGRGSLPETLIVLGSGFKGFEACLAGMREIELAEVPNFPVPQVEGHGAKLCVGTVGSREIAVLTGRVHMYEGYSARKVVYPIRTLARLGVRKLLLTNAAGSVDPQVKPGQVVVIRDHANLTGRNCLIGTQAQALGSVFIDMTATYDLAWRQALLRLGGLVEGVYAGVLGPSYESPAETALIAKLGCQVVGMSTVQEVLAARQLGLRVACLSFVSNMAGGFGTALSHADVLMLVAEHKPRLQDLLVKAVGVVP